MKPSPVSRNDFEALFENHELAFRVYAKVLLPTWDAVDEVMQTASLVMWRKMEELDSSEGFLPWGKVVVRFTALKYLRTQSRDPLVFDPDLIEFLVQEEEEWDEERFEKRQAALTQCLDALGDQARKLVLSPYQGHGYLTKLAEASGRTRNSLYKQIRRIRSKLEQCVLQQLEVSP
ncbi:MAG: sigma-70 family RNA polymerase sigma factor [Verrucomicrobiales bacterium]|nr:sigma-70 family RNA polymerase sigma factor [Verrucomicrobiales bacterium]